MMRSLYSGVAGLKTHQVKMDVIGNNIANVNTTAYKASSIVFSELMSQTTQKASGPNSETGTGGTNARQIGLGVRSGAINVNIEGQGSSQSTGNPFDIMITGSNFFVVSNGSSNFFTRDGSFYVDGAGNLAMTSTGYNVMGWGVDEETGKIKQDTVSALRIMSAANKTYPPEATSKAYVSGILDKNDKDVTSANGKTINLNFYDNLGYSYTARLTFKQSDDKTNYSVELTKLLDSVGNEVDISNVTFGDSTTQEKATVAALNTDVYQWAGTPPVLQKKDGGTAVLTDTLANIATAMTNTPDGEPYSEAVQADLDALAAAYNYEGSTQDFLNLYVDVTDGAADPTITPTKIEDLLKAGTFPAALSGTDIVPPGGATTNENTPEKFTASGRFYQGTALTFDPDNGKFTGIGGQNNSTIKLALGSMLGGNFSDIEIDFSEVSMYDNKGTSTVGATSGDLDGLGSGRKLGDMIGVSVQSDGCIYASYDNGMTKLLGQIATADFPNASGLEKTGDNLYSATLNSGEFDGIGVNVTANGGYMSTGQLEMSNVDLSSEFTEMITTQRGFQANSRIITVSDTLLEELTNLKR